MNWGFGARKADSIQLSSFGTYATALGYARKKSGNNIGGALRRRSFSNGYTVYIFIYWRRKIVGQSRVRHVAKGGLLTKLVLYVPSC